MALLHLCVKLSPKRFLFFFACLGDTEVIALLASKAALSYTQSGACDRRGPDAACCSFSSAPPPRNVCAC